MSDPAPSVDRQTLADLVAAMGAAPTDDVVHMMVPLMRQVAALHAQGRVAALGGADVFEGDDGALNLVRAMGQPPTLNLDGLQRTQPRVVSGLKIVGEYRVTTDAASGSQVEDLSAATESGEEITKPVYLPGYRSWEIEIGHHDDITDVFQLGMIMASLACGLDFTRDGEVERFSKARQNLFALAPRLHPVVATLILETTALNRQDRARDIDSLAQRLLSYRDQPAGLAVERVLAEAKGAPDRRAAVLAHLRDRLFDLSRRNRLIHFRPTQASVNLTEASVPLVLRVESIRSEQICAWSDGLSKSLLPGGAVALNTCLRFEEHPYLPSALDRIIQETRRDRADYGFSNLRLVIGFLHWNNLKGRP